MVRFRAGCVLTLMLLLQGCAVLKPDLEPVQVSLVDIRVLDLGRIEQHYRLWLRLQNLNAIPLPIRGIRYQMSINGRPLGSEVDPRSVDMQAFGMAEIELRVSARDPELREQIRRFEAGAVGALDYQIEGTLGFANDLSPLKFSGSGRLGEEVSVPASGPRDRSGTAPRPLPKPSTPSTPSPKPRSSTPVGG